MPYVYDVGGKKIVYWQWERVPADKLFEAVKKEFPEMFSNRLGELEFFVSAGAIALVKKGTFASATEYYPVLHDVGELCL